MSTDVRMSDTSDDDGHGVDLEDRETPSQAQQQRGLNPDAPGGVGGSPRLDNGNDNDNDNDAGDRRRLRRQHRYARRHLYVLEFVTDVSVVQQMVDDREAVRAASARVQGAVDEGV